MSITVYAREEDIPAGVYLADCAVSGGSLIGYLQSALEAAHGKLCMVLSPVYMDFPLPCHSGVGNILTQQEAMERRNGAPCYFSELLCTEYFTYASDETAHVVLMDTPRSLREKAKAIRAAGIPMVLTADPTLRQLFG